MALLLLIFFMIIQSDIFIDKVLRKVPGSVNNMTPTNKGTLIQGIFLVLFYMIMDMIVNSGVI
jgi:hypothetical protein